MKLTSRRRITRIASGLAFAAVAAAVVIPSAPASAQTLFSRANCSIDGVPVADGNESEDSPGNYAVVFAVDWPTTAAVDDVVTTPRVSIQNIIAGEMFDLDGLATPDTVGVDIGHTLGEFTVIDPTGDESSASIDATKATLDGVGEGVSYSAGFLQSLTLSEAGTYKLNWNRLSGTMTNTVDGVTESHDWECVPATSPWTLASIEVSGAETSNPPADPSDASSGDAVVTSDTAAPTQATSPKLAETGTDSSMTSAVIGASALAAGLLAVAATRNRRRGPSQR